MSKAESLLELDWDAWRAVEDAIRDEARRLCREGCHDEPCHCRAENDKDWRRDAINALRAKDADNGK